MSREDTGFAAEPNLSPFPITWTTKPGLKLAFLGVQGCRHSRIVD